MVRMQIRSHHFLFCWAIARLGVECYHINALRRKDMPEGVKAKGKTMVDYESQFESPAYAAQREQTKVATVFK